MVRTMRCEFKARGSIVGEANGNIWFTVSFIWILTIFDNALYINSKSKNFLFFSQNVIVQNKDTDKYT